MRRLPTAPTATAEVCCAGCGITFTVELPKYHSIECYVEHIRRPALEATCVVCGKVLTGRPNSRRVDGQRFYCQDCYRNRPPRPVPLLFYARVDLNSDAPCHRWTGARDPRGGHGRFHTKEGTVLAHRMAFRLWYGREGAPVLHHRCGHPWCVNPEHLQELESRATHRRVHATGRWSLRYDQCVLCGRTDREHESRGRCRRCMDRLTQRRRRSGG